MPVVLSPGSCVYPAEHPERAGSYGIPVRDLSDGEIVFLTAAHVVGALSVSADEAADVYISYLRGVGSAADRPVGQLKRSAPERFADQVSTDAALVSIRDGVELNDVIRAEHPSCVARDITNEPMKGEIVVHKRGINGFTTGLLERSPAIVPDAHLVRPGNEPVEVTYYNGYFIHSAGEEPFARDGDSGSIVVDDDDCVVGMIVALQPGETQAEDRAFCVPIVSILEDLQIELIGPSRPCTLADYK